MLSPNNGNQANKVGTSGTNILAINQPYFFPYLGYFSLILYSDIFVLYDNIEYSKRGWTNRNRILSHGRPLKLSLPLRSAPDSTWISRREIASEFTLEKFFRILEGAYRKAPHWKQLEEFIAELQIPANRSLFDFLAESISSLCQLFEIKTPILRYSDINSNSADVVGEERIFVISEALGAKRYVNLPGGREIYTPDSFRKRGLTLEFLDHIPREYPQIVPSVVETLRPQFFDRLSVLDVIANIGIDETASRIQSDFRIV